jgi:hypothetical protein
MCELEVEAKPRALKHHPVKTIMIFKLGDSP